MDGGLRDGRVTAPVSAARWSQPTKTHCNTEIWVTTNLHLRLYETQWSAFDFHRIIQVLTKLHQARNATRFTFVPITFEVKARPGTQAASLTAARDNAERTLTFPLPHSKKPDIMQRQSALLADPIRAVRHLR